VSRGDRGTLGHACRAAPESERGQIARQSPGLGAASAIYAGLLAAIIAALSAVAVWLIN
jgi:hypothetical protein